MSPKGAPQVIEPSLPRETGGIAPLPPIVRPTAQAVFAEHAAFVLRSVRRLGVRPADVEDVAQEVFVVVHRKLETWNGTSSMRTWLFGIALRVSSDYRRKAYVRREQLDDDRMPQRERSVPPDQAEALRRKELRALLDRALDALDDNRRAVFVLYELEGVPMAEIAAHEGCALFTAYGRLREARAQVRARFVQLQESKVRS